VHGVDKELFEINERILCHPELVLELDSVVQIARHKRVGLRPSLDLSVHGALHDGCPSFFCVPLLRLLHEYGPIILSP
jgi:hypothetical protein